jgi:integrase
MALTDVKVKNEKPKEKPFKLSDEKGLYLLIKPSSPKKPKGSKCWRFKYRFLGKEKTLSIGMYPDVTLSEAREARDNARSLLKKDIDPSTYKQTTKQSNKLSLENTFERVAIEWHLRQCTNMTNDHKKRVMRLIEVDLFPWIGKRAITEITARELLTTLERIEKRGAIETAHRALQICGRIFRYAVIIQLVKTDITRDLKGALRTKIEKHFASITNPKEVGGLLRSLYSYHGSFVTQCALRLAPLTFVRPGELRHAEWSEINFDTATWRIPGKKMKMKEEHIIPLSSQSLNILRELHPLTGSGKYVFPGVRTPLRPMSENTVLAALRRLGYSKDEMSGHGFRSLACTLLNEQGWNRDAIERQMAHSERNQVRAAYHRAEYLDIRRKMMQAWADYLDSLM